MYISSDIYLGGDVDLEKITNKCTTSPIFANHRPPTKRESRKPGLSRPFALRPSPLNDGEWYSSFPPCCRKRTHFSPPPRNHARPLSNAGEAGGLAANPRMQLPGRSELVAAVSLGSRRLEARRGAERRGNPKKGKKKRKKKDNKKRRKVNGWVAWYAWGESP